MIRSMIDLNLQKVFWLKFINLRGNYTELQKFLKKIDPYRNL